MFEISKAQKAIQKAARDFAKGEFDKETICEMEKNSEFPETIWRKAADLGFICIHFPEVYGGGGLGSLENVLITEEFCRRDSSVGGALAHAGHAAECLLRFGDEDLKQAFLPQVAGGEILSAGAFGETGYGSDLADIRATAEKNGDAWVVNGTKTHVINGGEAGFYIVLCRTEPAADAEASLILVEADRAGVSAEHSGRKLGGNLTATADVTFENVRVPLSHRIGPAGKGISQVRAFLDEHRILLAAQSLGTALGAFDRMLEYVKGREQFGRKIALFQVSQHKIADMATKIELARLVTYKAAWTRDQGKTDPSLCSMAKMTACRTAMEIGAQTIQLFGGYGYMTEYEVERFYRDAKVAEILAGTGRMQKDVIADAVIGKVR